MESSPTCIRAAERKDLSRLFELLQSKAQFDGSLDLLVATEEAIAAAVFDDAPKCEVLVADSSGELVGFAVFYPTFSTYHARPGIWMDDLFVESESRGKGVGRLLLQGLSRIAVDRGCARIEWTVTTSNVRGISFYEREGARLLESQRVARMDQDVFSKLVSE
jgi:GNAT superfamily N-acetyltransferase